MSIVSESIGAMIEDRHVVYIAGKMRGLAGYGFDRFDDAAARFRANGWDVISPAEMDRQVGVYEHTHPLPPNFLRQAMSRDLAAICECDAIALIPGWETSEGVAVELALAKLLGLEVLDACTGEPMPMQADEE